MAKKRRSGRKKIILFVFEILLLLIVLLVVWAYNKTLGQVKYEDALTNSEAGINEEIDEDVLANMHGYLNVALFGLDNRSNGSYDEGHSDCIMIASLNYDTKEVQLVSVYRDTYLPIGNGKFAKANAAYANGGAKRAVAMLNSNLDLNITKYVCVDWKALVDAIDDIGGLDLEITNAEMKEINYLIPEVDYTTGYNTPYLEGDGMQHLDGTQATCYARIRSTSGDDFLRASRQRIVLQAMLEKAKKANPATLVKICNSMVDDISTTLSLDQMVSLAKDVTKYKISSTTGFPTDLTTKNMSRCGDTVIPADLVTNVKKLHEYMFDDAAYTPSQTVQAISETIVNTTGITADSAKINTSDYNETVGATGTDEIQKGSETTGGTNVQ